MGRQVRWGAEERNRRGQRRFKARDKERETAAVEGGGGGREGNIVFVPTYLVRLPANPLFRYGGYNEQMINRFVWMGFDLDRVVSAFDYVGIDPNEGEDYELEEAYIGDITARLLGEP